MKALNIQQRAFSSREDASRNLHDLIQSKQQRVNSPIKRLTTPVLTSSNNNNNQTTAVHFKDERNMNNNNNNSMNEPKIMTPATPRDDSNAKEGAINYKNCRKIEPQVLSFTNYYRHREALPQNYHSLVQFLEKTEVKYHNDNLFEQSPIGFPTRAQLLKERVYHLPILKDTNVEKCRYRRKLNDKQHIITTARKKFDFRTFENYSSHYFLTGARFNRNDTIDSKILNKYGVFINRKNPELVYIKSPEKAIRELTNDMDKLTQMKFDNPSGKLNEIITKKIPILNNSKYIYK